MEKKRLDVFLVDNSYFLSRERARAAIMAGEIFVNGQKADKAGFQVDADAQITVTGDKLPYVSRGGLKLEKAIKAFELNLSDKVILDIGASTGGFTDCALQNSASKVYAVDVGYGQLAWKLRQDERVIVLERTNARYLSSAEIPENVDIATFDASFISLNKIFPAVAKLLKADGYIVALIKPQFEAGRENVGKKGVVRDAKIHESVISRVTAEAVASGLYAKKLAVSPIKGPEGNIEFLCLFTLIPPLEINEATISEVVKTAHGGTLDPKKSES